VSPAARRTVAYWLLLLLPALAVGGAAIVLLRKEQGRLAAQQATAGEARRAAATARAGLIVENTELLIGDVETALLDALAGLPVAGLDVALAQWEQSNPLVRKAWRCAADGRILRPAATANDEESRAFRRRFAPLLEAQPPWRTSAKDAVDALLEGQKKELDFAANEEERAVRQKASSNVAKLQSARRDAQQSSARQYAADYAAPAAVSALEVASASEGAGAQSAKPAEPERRGWTPWPADGRLHLLGWIERPASGEIRGVELEVAALIARLGGALPAETQSDEGYALRDEKGRIMHQVGWVPRDAALGVATLPLAATSLPGWDVVAFLEAPTGRNGVTGSGFFLVGSLLVGILVIAILAGGSLLLGQARRSEAEAAQKTSFVANVSHEFKTPLTTIRLYTELLEQGRVPEETKRRDYLQTIGREAQRLSRLVGNALDFSRLEQGEKKYAREPVDLRAVIAQLLDTHAPRLGEAGLQLHRQLPVDPVVRMTDRDAVEQVVLNLLDNAAKYAASGGEATVELGTATGGGAVVRVLDRGPGVPAAHRERIFDKFHRVDDSLTAEKGGTGLGLSIARQLARGLGGDLRYESRDGGGSVFVFTLP
jgi:two-component system phosphate regulon sensor histidine kinase PhoR